MVIIHQGLGMLPRMVIWLHQRAMTRSWFRSMDSLNPRFIHNHQPVLINGVIDYIHHAPIVESMKESMDLWITRLELILLGGRPGQRCHDPGPCFGRLSLSSWYSLPMMKNMAVAVGQWPLFTSRKWTNCRNVFCSQPINEQDSLNLSDGLNTTHGKKKRLGNPQSFLC